MGEPVFSYEINCRNIDTKYRVVQNIASQLSHRGDTPIRYWMANRQSSGHSGYKNGQGRRVHIIVLDEIDNLVARAGDGILQSYKILIPF